MEKVAESVGRPGVRSQTGGVVRGWTQFYLAAGVVVVCAAAVRLVWIEWEFNPQYQFGFLFLPAALYLLWLRWVERPEPGCAAGVGRMVGLGVAFACVGILTVVQPVFEANPDWRLMWFVGVGAAVGWGLGVAWLAGGWPWLAALGPGILLFLFGLPWPKGFEDAVTGGLMEANTALVVEALNWCGYGAVREGRLIQLSDGQLGVEEACSGVRALQGSLVAAVVAGEYFRLRAGWRIGLVALGVGLALVGNFIRAMILAWIAVTWGSSQVNIWHDPTGLTIMAASSAGVVLLGYWIAGRQMKGRRRDANPHAGGSLGALPRNHAALVLPVLVLPLGWVCSEGWFRLHERGAMPVAPWRYSSQSGKHDGEIVEIPERTLQILRYPKGFSERWVGEDGVLWQAFYFQWQPGRVATQVTHAHHPTICLDAAGFELEKKLEPLRFSNGPPELEFEAFAFSARGHPVYVFHATAEDRRLGDAAQSGGYSVGSRLAAVAAGRRNPGQRMVQISASGPISEAAARQTVQDLLAEAIQTTAP